MKKLVAVCCAMFISIVLNAQVIIKNGDAIAFMGDSITQQGNTSSAGYVNLVMKGLEVAGVKAKKIPAGVSGNKSNNMLDRLERAVLAKKPQWMTFSCGVNDVWHRHSHGREMTDEQFEANYRAVLKRIRKETHAKILILCPFLLPSSDKEDWRDEVERIGAIVRRLADEYADAYLPLDEKFAEALPTAPTPMHYSLDGVHPNAAGAEFIGGLYCEAILPLLQ